MSSIKLSKEHGVNPSVFHCFWCGREMGIALFGRLPKDAEAPRSTVINYAFCEHCLKDMAMGVTFIEATPTPNWEGQPRFGQGYPTGRWAVIGEGNFKNSVTEDFYNKVMSAGRKLFILPEDAESLGIFNTTGGDVDVIN